MRGIIVCEGEFHEVVEFPTELFNAYSSGIVDGANLYGAGSCGVYTLDDLKELNPNNKYDAPIIKLIKEHLE